MVDKGAKGCKGCNRVLRINYESDFCPECLMNGLLYKLEEDGVIEVILPFGEPTPKVTKPKPEPEPAKPSED